MGNDIEHFNNYSSGPVVGVDALGRNLPTIKETKPLEKDKYVGIFYFICNGQHGDTGKMHICNVSKLLEQYPDAGYKPDSSIWPKGETVYYWGEPLYDYYLSSDEWVIRKHIKLLTYADIDFLVFDTTNGFEYLNVAKKIFKILNDARLDGWKVPKIVYYTNTKAGEAAQRIYETVYKKNLYPELWFKIDGKPLIITHEAECSDEVKKFFTIRESQWPNEPDHENGFPWISFIRPQKVYYDKKGEHGTISVSVAQHPEVSMGDSAMYGEDGNWGRSYHNGKNHNEPGAVNYGFNIKEQWQQAYKQNPEIVFVTGWNEWTMGKFKGSPERPVLFVDEANQEFSRDIEPMKGGHFDNYYMQLIDSIRHFKGTCEIPNQSEKHTIDINGDFNQWKEILITYRNLPNGALPRNYKGFGNAYYNNDTGRNEFESMKVAHDNENIYFYVKTRNEITPYDSKSTWMKLFLGIKGSTNNWNGYNFIANYCPENDNQTTIVEYTNDSMWIKRANIPYKQEGNEFMLSVPKKVLKIKDSFSINFKWADAKVNLKSIEDFYIYGDTAPIGRLNYLFKSKE